MLDDATIEIDAIEVLHTCRCCLQRAPDRGLKTPYTHNGQREIYSDMLKECFDLHLTPGSGECGICEACVGRLRDASDFKLQVRLCQAELQARLETAILEIDVETEVNSDTAAAGGTPHEPPDVEAEAKPVAAGSGGPPASPGLSLTETEDGSSAADAEIEVISDSSDDERAPDGSPDAADVADVEPKPEPGDDQDFLSIPLDAPSPDVAEVTHALAAEQLVVSYSVRLERLSDDAPPPPHAPPQAPLTPPAPQAPHTPPTPQVPHTPPAPHAPPPAPRRTREKQDKRSDKQDPLICDICGRHFYLKMSIANHIRHHMAPEFYACEICGKRFTLKGNRDQHVAIHSGVRPFACAVCGKRFTQRSNLRAHEFVHATSKRYKCEICEKQFTRRDQFNEHVVSHSGRRPHKCRICYKTFSGQSTLRTHMRFLHEPGDAYFCELCPKMFNRKASLALHLTTHARRKSPRDSSRDKSVNRSRDALHKPAPHAEVPSVSCDICDKRFSQRSFMRHLKIHTGEKPYTCDICNKQFARKDSIESHMIVHMGLQRFGCRYCDKRCMSATRLTLHERIHTGEKPFGCDVCGKRFNVKSSLGSHLRLHTGEKPFSCTVCDQKFAHSSSRRKHMRQHAADGV